MDLIEQQVLATASPVRDGEPGADAGLAPVLDELSHGVIVVDADSTLQHANYAGRQELARGRVIGLRSHRLQALHPNAVNGLQAAITRGTQGKRSLVELQGLEGPPLTAVVTASITPGMPARVVLMLARTTVCDPLMLYLFAKRHGLTPAEQQVLAILCEGYSAPDTAVQLKVAVSTVRSHVRSLCAKTGSSGVRELVGRVAVLPPMALAHHHVPVH